MPNVRPTAVDLFCGAGGLSLGLEMAGFDVRAGVEVDPVHAAVHEYNFPECKLLVQSISDVSSSSLLGAARVGKGELDLLAGGAPCQGFSLMGKRALDDPRNSLVRDFIRLIDEVNPRYFLFENVKGLTVGKHRMFLDEIVEAVAELGYQVTLPWQVLDAVHYGVPQSRKRFFLLGHRSDCAPPGYPSPTHRHPISGTGELATAPGCRDALDDLPDAELFEELLHGPTVQIPKWAELSDYVKNLRPLRLEDWNGCHPRTWDPMLLTASARTNHTSISRRRFAETKPGSTEPISRFYRLHPDGVCNTLRAGTPSKRGAFTSPRPIHYEYHRCVTVREMARLHGYPDWFQFHATKWNGGRQVGNSVPPPLAKAVAVPIRVALGADLHRPTSTLGQKPDSLLTLTNKSAAKYFSAEALPSKRDQTSPFKKRKQADIEAQRIAGIAK